MHSLKPLTFLFTAILFTTLLLACSNSPAKPDVNTFAPYLDVLDKIITDTKTALIPLSQLPEARGNDAAACTAVMAEKLKSYTQYTTFGAAHLDGTLFCTSQVQTAPANILDRAYFKRAVETKDISVGDYQIGKVTGKKSVGIGYPILDSSNNVQGIVLSPVDLEWLNQHLAALQLPADAELVLLDSQGNILAHVPGAPDMLGKPAADSPLTKAMLAQSATDGVFTGLDGVSRSYLLGSPKNSNNNWHLALGLKK
jgi:Cache domain